MSAFKIKLFYENPNHEEIVDVIADSSESARNVCSEMIGRYEENMRRLESKNIYVSRRLLFCGLADEV